MARAYGPMIDRVCRLSGTLGSIRLGRLSGSLPSSPTVGMATAASTVTAVRATIATRGAGTALVNRGRTTMIRMPTAMSG